MFCPNCGTSNEEGVAFCSNCGGRLTPEQPAPQPQPAPQSAPQPVYSQPVNQYQYTQPAASINTSNSNEGSGKAIGSFLCGLFGVLINCACCLSPWVAVIFGIILAILAFVFAGLSKKDAGRMPGLSGSGITLGIIALLIALPLLFILISAQSAIDNLSDSLSDIDNIEDLLDKLEDINLMPRLFK